MLFSTFSSVYNKDSGSLSPHVPCQSAPSLPTGITCEHWCIWFIFFKLSQGFAWWDHPTVFIFCLPTILLYGIESKSIWKWDESPPLPWIIYQELKLDLTYWEGRERVSPNKAQPFWHIQSFMSLPPGFGTRGSTVVPRIKALSSACSRAKTACF